MPRTPLRLSSPHPSVVGCFGQTAGTCPRTRPALLTHLKQPRFDSEPVGYEVLEAKVSRLAFAAEIDVFRGDLLATFVESTAKHGANGLGPSDPRRDGRRLADSAGFLKQSQRFLRARRQERVF
jgi:hypothetical protein